MNFIDIIVIIPLLWGAFKGFKNGLISEGGTIAALILGIYGAMKFSSILANVVGEYTSIEPQYQQITAFGLTFVVVIVLCYIVTRVILRFCKAINILWLDKLMGIVFGITKYLIVLSFLFYLANTLIKNYATKPIEVVEESVLFTPMAEFAETFISGNIEIPQFEKPDFFEPLKQLQNENK